MAGPTLLEYLSSQFIVPITRKGWFSGECVRVDEYLRAAQRLFEIGAALGAKFHGRVEVLSTLLGWTGREGGAATLLDDPSASDPTPPTQEPRDFLDVFLRREVNRLERAILGVQTDLVTPRSKLGRLGRQKRPSTELQAALKIAGEKGLDLGLREPDLIARLSSQETEPSNWKLYRARSSYLPEAPPRPRSLEDRQADAMGLLRDYVEQYHPDQLARLGLWPEKGNDFLQRLRAITSRLDRSE